MPITNSEIPIQNLTKTINLYPNPSSGKFIIEGNEIDGSEIKNLAVIELGNRTSVT